MRKHTKQRYLDLCDAALRIAGEGALTLEEVADRLTKVGAPSYYVSRDYAYKAYSRVRNGGLKNATPQVAQRWQAFADDVDAYRSRHGDMSLIEAVDFVAHHGRAPRFFFAKATILTYLRRMTHMVRSLDGEKMSRRAVRRRHRR